MATLVLAPHVPPRGLRDAFIAVVALLLIAAGALFVAYLPLRLLFDPVRAMTGALVFAGAVLVGVALCTVFRLELDDAGIRFRRLLGRPRFLGWEDVTAVRSADRAEVVLRGWLLPPLPPRGAALTLTSIGHYRFDWKGGSCYFPPADEHALLEVLERNWGGVLGEPPPG